MHTQIVPDRGLGLLMRLNWDRLVSGVIVFLSLTAGAWLATM